MSQHLIPRRGKKATATSELINNNTLERGEIFFEVPDTGVGTGAGKIKMGDGESDYEDLPYFITGSGGGGDAGDLEDFVGYPGELSPSHIDHETQLINLDNTRMKIDGSNAEDIVTFPGSFSQGPNTFLTAHIWESVSTLPYDFYYGSAVVYNNEIHILGSSSNTRSHYKWNGQAWESVSTLPYNFYSGSAVVYNNEIHIMGSANSSYRKYHYKYNGQAWESVSTLPYNFYSGSAVVYNNEIHIMGGSSVATNHYKWNGQKWQSAPTLPYSFYNGTAVVYNNEIHILGSYDSNYRTYHYKYNGQSWQSVSTLPYDFYEGSAVVYNNEIHLLGSENNSYYKYHYKYNGTRWESLSSLPYNFYYGSAVVYNNEIHIMGSANSSSYKMHMKFVTLGNPYAYTEGYNNTVAGLYSHTEGRAAQAIGNSSHAEGYNAQAIGNCSHAEGCNTKAIGSYSHAEGYGTRAGTDYSHAEGYNTDITVGNYCHAEGSGTYINSGSPEASHLEGAYTRTDSSYTYSGGNRSFAFAACAMVQGGDIWSNPLEITNGNTNERKCFGLTPYTYQTSYTTEASLYAFYGGISRIIRDGDYTITIPIETCAIYLLFCVSYTISSGAIYGATTRMVVGHGLSSGNANNLNLGQTTNAPATISVAANNKLTIRSGTASRSVMFHLVRIL